MRRLQRMKLARRKIKKGAPATIEWYSERFRVDRRCAAKELMQLGHCTTEDYIREGGVIKEKVETERRLSHREWERLRRAQGLPDGYWEEGGEAPEYGISFIAGFTEGGCPYGLTYEQFDPETGLIPSSLDDEDKGLPCSGLDVDGGCEKYLGTSELYWTESQEILRVDDSDEVPF